MPTAVTCPFCLKQHLLAFAQHAPVAQAANQFLLLKIPQDLVFPTSIAQVSGIDTSKFSPPGLIPYDE